MFTKRTVILLILLWLCACNQPIDAAWQTEVFNYVEPTGPDISTEASQTPPVVSIKNTPQANPSPSRSVARSINQTASAIPTNLDQIPISTAEKITPTISSTKRATPLIPWIIFARSFTDGYLTIDPLANAGKTSEELSIEQAGKMDPGWCAIDLSFSNSADRVSYITSRCEVENEQPRELWIADLGLSEIERIWLDDGYWLGKGVDISSAFSDYSLIWGKNDRYLLVSSNREDSNNHMIIYDILVGKGVEFFGDCQGLVRNKNTETIDTLCTDLEGKATYLILEDQGIIEYPEPPGESIRTHAWRFSPDGEKVLFVREDNRYEIIGKDGKSLALALEFSVNPDYPNSESLNMQWTEDNSKILVYGKEINSQHCPQARYWISEKEFQDSKQSCWFVLDAATGEFLWRPDETMSAAVNVPIEYMTYPFNMAISPDGQWLATTIADSRIGHLYHFVISSIELGSSWEIPLDPFALPIYYLIWTHKS